MKTVGCRSALAREKSSGRRRCVGCMLRSEDVSAVPAPSGIGGEPVTNRVLALPFAGKRAPTCRLFARTDSSACPQPFSSN